MVLDLGVAEKIKDIPFVTSDGKSENAALMRVPLPVEDLNSLSDDEAFVVERLVSAASRMNPIVAQQRDPYIIPVYRDIERFASTLPHNTSQRLAVDDYLDLLAASNSLTDLEGLGFVFPLSPESIPDSFPVAKAFAYQYSDASTIPKREERPKGRGMYPLDVTKEDLDSLSKSDREMINSTVVKDRLGNLSIVLNEERFSSILSGVISDIESALSRTPQGSNLAKYMTATIEELRTGSPEARKAADIAWLANDSKIDFRLRTAEETYTDQLAGLRGAASASVMLVDHRFMDLCSRVSSLLPEIEASAPWKHKKVYTPGERGADLRVVNVINWGADYDDMPNNILAQALPNEKEIIDNHGSRLMIYRNVQEAVRKSGVYGIAAKSMMTSSELERYGRRMTGDLTMKMTIVHEQGHTTGGVATNEDARVLFGEEFSVMEEGRAELISMHGLPILAKHGMIEQEDVVAGYYCMLQNIAINLRVAPVHHAGARKMMFNYFLEQGGLRRVEEDGTDKYVVDPAVMPVAVSKMLGLIGDFKSEGRVEEYVGFRKKYWTADPEGQQKYFKDKITGLPRGRLMIFPELKDRNISFSPNYRDQKRTLTHNL
jgi:hypothetical protein